MTNITFSHIIKPMRKCYIYGIYKKDNPEEIIYVGQHNYSNINDSYMGSGKELLKLYKECGKNNFGKVILEDIEYDEKAEEDKTLIGEREKFYILKYKSIGQAELNISKGSNPSITVILPDNITFEERKTALRRKNKELKKEYDKEYYELNKSKKINQSKKYYSSNRERVLQKVDEYKEKNKEEIKEKSKIYRENNKEEIREKKKAYREKNKEEISRKKREKYLEDRENILRRQRAVKYLKESNIELFKTYSSLKSTKEKKDFLNNICKDIHIP